MLTSKLESILFLSNRPLAIKKLAVSVEAGEREVAEAIEVLKQKYNQEGSGVRLLSNGQEFQFTTAPENAVVVQKFIKEEGAGELTRPQLETLTIIAYRAPITKVELEQIRGVNCTLILRNLSMRGLIEFSGELTEPTTEFSLSMDFLRHLGLSSVQELPDYESLSRDSKIDELLQSSRQESA